MGWANKGGWRDEGWGQPAAAAGAATTWDPANKFQITLSNGNLTATNSVGAGNFGVARSTTSHATGKFYVEWLVQFSATDACNFGVCNASQVIGGSQIMGAGPNNMGAESNNGTVSFNDGGTGTVGNWAASGAVNGDTICMAIDIDASKVWFRKNSGAWNNGAGSADPASGTAGFAIGVTGALYLFCDIEGNTINGTLAPGPTYAFTAPSGGFGSW